VPTLRRKENGHQAKSRLIGRLFVWAHCRAANGHEVLRLVHCEPYQCQAHSKHMRFQGKITSWKDDQGFGFITPNGGSDPVFVHIKAFSNTRRRPVGNEIVTYELRADGKRGPRAANVAFVGKRGEDPKSSGAGWGSMAFAGLFLVVVLGAVLAGDLPPAVLALYAGASVLAYFAYARDKSAARENRWRTEENTLHVLALAGGWPGALLAQRVLRHKSKKKSFQLMFWITVVTNCGGLLICLSPTASHAVLSILIN
jgi:uncharacterized membrane protein YsdA (DUF1294 family)/cold shock CspA family protein